MSTLHVPRCPITTYHTTLSAGSSVAGELDQEGKRVMAINAKHAIL